MTTTTGNMHFQTRVIAPVCKPRLVDRPTELQLPSYMVPPDPDDTECEFGFNFILANAQLAQAFLPMFTSRIRMETPHVSPIQRPKQIATWILIHGIFMMIREQEVQLEVLAAPMSAWYGRTLPWISYFP